MKNLINSDIKKWIYRDRDGEKWKISENSFFKNLIINFKSHLQISNNNPQFKLN